VAKTWVLDTETKGTGANMVPLEKVEKQPEGEPRRGRKPVDRRATPRQASSERARSRGSARSSERNASALPSGHVRKKATGEIGRVRAVDPRAGTASVHWLKRGATSTVPLSSISRR
jgi:hypothetical protein